ncbi:Ankyrin-R [Cladobotryum mycophilum]|uniref:Ankyrin-R n=1 Tax=Cladobotryum mycophilum TaxID=491253 RepID=A0ABR0SM17_9HYPO
MSSVFHYFHMAKGQFEMGPEFNMIIVNEHLPKLDPYTKDFTIIPTDEGIDIPALNSGFHQSAETHSRSNAIFENTSSKEEENDKQTEVLATIENDPVMSLEQQVLELIIEVPNLHSVRKHLHRLASDCGEDVELQQLIFAWLRSRAIEVSHSDFEDEICNLMPISPEKTFTGLFLPQSTSYEYRQQMTTATGLLLYSFRSITDTELSHLERSTSYGQQVGRASDTYPLHDTSTRSLSVLKGLAVIRQSEVQFCHTRFRDFLISRAKTSDLEFGFASEDGARHAHARIAGWCLESISRATTQDWERFGTNDESRVIIESHKDFLSYAIRYWVRHLKSFASRNVDVVSSIVQWVKQRPEAIRDTLNTIGWAAYHGLMGGVEMLISILPPAQAKEATLAIAELLAVTPHALDGGPEMISLLKSACKVGDSAVATFLSRHIFSDYSVTSGNEEWSIIFRSAIGTTIANGHPHTLRALLDIASTKHWHDPESLKRLVEFANWRSMHKCCKELLSHLKVTTEHDKMQEVVISALHSAVMIDSEPLVRDLKNRPINVIKTLEEEGFRACGKDTYSNALTRALWTALVDKNEKIALFLVEKTAEKLELEDKTPLLLMAAQRGHKTIVKAFLEAKVDPEVIGDHDGWRPIHAAYKNAEILLMIIEAGANVNAKDYLGRTSLFYACRDGYKDCVKILLEHKAKIYTFSDGETELSVTISEYPDISCMLLDADVNPLEYPAKDLDTPLLQACVRENHVNVLKMLLVHDIPVNEVDKDGKTALHWINASTTVPVVRLLVNRGAARDKPNAEKQTPLLVAIQCDNAEVAKYLISMGANINAHIGRHGSVLHFACYQSSAEMVRLLVEEGADVNRNDPGINGTPLHAALRHLEQSSSQWGSPLSVASLCADLEVVENLFHRGADVNAEDKMGRRPIHFALYRTLDYVQRLIDAGADLNSIDRMKRNALYFAVVSGRLDVVRYVLAHNKDFVTQNDIDGWTPLMWAVRICRRWDTETNEREEIVRELLKHGVDRRVQGEGLDRKWTAYELACYYGLNEEIVKLVKPSEKELEQLNNQQRAFWHHTIAEQKKVGTVRRDDYCGACLMMSVGTSHSCDSCPDFVLCFKCYRSRNVIHPGHSFRRLSEDYKDETADSSAEDSDEKENDVRQSDSSNGEDGEEDEEEEDEQGISESSSLAG